jgi:hypothetical protein
MALFTFFRGCRAPGRASRFVHKRHKASPSHSDELAVSRTKLTNPILPHDTKTTGCKLLVTNLLPKNRRLLPPGHHEPHQTTKSPNLCCPDFGSRRVEASFLLFVYLKTIGREP